MLYSAFSVVAVSLFDMDRSMDLHSFFSSTWVFFTNVMEVLQFISVVCTLYSRNGFLGQFTRRITGSSVPHQQGSRPLPLRRWHPRLCHSRHVQALSLLYSLFSVMHSVYDGYEGMSVGVQ